MRGNKKKLLAEFTEGSCMITFKKSTEISTLQSWIWPEYNENHSRTIQK